MHVRQDLVPSRRPTKVGVCVLPVPAAGSVKRRNPVSRLYRFLVLCALVVVSCGGSTVYVKPGEVTYTSGFSDTDLRLMAEKMAASLVECTSLSGREIKAKVALQSIRNGTSEYIDTETVLDKIMVACVKTGRIGFVDRKILRDIAQEQGIVETGQRDLTQELTVARLSGADYFLTGSLVSIEKSSSAKETSWYRLSLRLVDVRTGEISWADEAELKKVTTSGFFDE
jgi:uncharacterized protein (TIGR02722 family)